MPCLFKRSVRVDNAHCNSTHWQYRSDRRGRRTHPTLFQQTSWRKLKVHPWTQRGQSCAATCYERGTNYRPKPCVRLPTMLIKDIRHLLFKAMESVQSWAACSHGPLFQHAARPIIQRALRASGLWKCNLQRGAQGTYKFHFWVMWGVILTNQYSCFWTWPLVCGLW